jgi:iron complex outermembrane receptor protein
MIVSNRKISHWLGSASAVALLGIATPALHAQEAVVAPATAADRSIALDDIVVTAQKRSQDLLDVPVAVTALDSEALAATGTTDIKALNFVSPSFNITVQQSKVSNNPVRIRGIGTTGTNPAFEGAVGVYIDGVYRSRAGLALSTFNDIGSVELLRGPQGTLFGKNTSAGAVLFSSTRPASRSEAGAELNVANYGAIRASAYMNMPASDTLALRVSGVYDRGNGFYRDPVTGEDGSDRDNFAVKFQALWEPTGDISARLIADYGRTSETCCYGSVSRAGPIQSPLLEPFYAGMARSIGRPYYGDAGNTRFSRDALLNQYGQDSTRDYGISLDLNARLSGSFSLRSITSYRRFKYEQLGGDWDFGPVNIGQDLNEKYGINSFSQELNGTLELPFLTDGSITSLVGGYYSNETMDYGRSISAASQLGFNWSVALAGALGPALPLFTADAPAIQAALGGNPAAFQALYARQFNIAPGAIGALATPGSPFAHSLFRSTDEVFAAFTHNTVKFNDRFSAVVGLRYSRENKRGRHANALFPGDPNGYFNYILANHAGFGLLGASTSGFEYDARQKDSEFTYNISLQYFPSEDIQIYATHARGFKAGGITLNPDAAGGSPNIGLWLAQPQTQQFLANAAVGDFGAGAPFPGVTAPAAPQFSAGQSPNYAPEQVKSYEVGVKAKYLNGRGRMALTGFIQDYSDIQFSVFTGTAFVTANGPTATTRGFELENSLQLTRDLRLDTSATWLADASFGKAVPGSSFAAGFPNLRDGRRLAIAPKFAGTATLAFDTPVSNRTNLSANLNLSYLSSHFGQVERDVKQPGRAVINMNLGLRDPDDRWYAGVFVRNLTKADYFDVTFDQPLVFSSPSMGYTGEPRTFGATVRVRFGS